MMMAIRKVGFFLVLWTLVFLSEVECTFPELWNFINPTTSTAASPTEKPVNDDVEFQTNGTQFHPTESYPYPTTPSPDRGFDKWLGQQIVQEQARKYADSVLATLKKLNETELRMLSKAIISKVGPKVLKDAMDDAAAEYGFNISMTEEPYYFEPETNTQKPTNLYPSQSPPPGVAVDYYLPPEEHIFEQDHEHLNNINEQQNNQNINVPPPAHPVIPIHINPVVSLINMLTQNTSSNASVASSPLGAIIGNVFGPKPSRTTPDPDVSTEYFIVPVNPITEPNAISKQAANIGQQVSRLVQNVNNRNISGVIDETLKIASLQTIGVALTGFLNQLLCNPLDRFNGRCDE